MRKINEKLITGFIGVFTASNGTISLIGYVIGNPLLYEWGQHIGMALNTAIGMTMIGIALIVQSINKRP